MKSERGSTRPDGELIAAIGRNGDEGAFRTLYRRHTPRLFMFVLRLVGGVESDAEDVVQETWIRATENLDGFRGESTFATWLTGIGLNVARNHLRRLERRRAADLEEIPKPAGLPPRHDERLDLERAISLLPDGYRMVLVLHDVEGLKHREIAAALEVSEGTSKSQLFAARRWIRSYLGQTNEVSHE